MTVRVTESVWLNASDTCTFEHIVEVSGLSRDELRDLVETGVIEPSGPGGGELLFHTHCVAVARRARRLRDDFELNTPGLALALTLLRRIDDLEEELALRRHS
jgi:chaperone modulatory protein CbpM